MSITNLEAVPFETLDELQNTYKPNHPTTLALKIKYGPNVKFSRVLYPKGHKPRCELIAYYIEGKGEK